MNSTVLTVKRTNGLTPMDTDLGLLPAKRGKRLWINPLQLVEMTHALAMAEWALQLSQKLRPTLPTPVRRGRKQVYRDSSIMIVALVQVAWWLGYEEVIDYFREHSEAAQAAGFPPGRVICASQYWERRRALGILPFWWLFVAMVWQLVRMAVIQGTDLIVDATIQRTWFHDDPDAGWSFPKPGKGSVFGYKVHTVVDRWSQLPVLFLITPANHQESTVAIRLLSLVAAIFPFLDPDRTCRCWLLHHADLELHPLSSSCQSYHRLQPASARQALSGYPFLSQPVALSPGPSCHHRTPFCLGQTLLRSRSCSLAWPHRRLSTHRTCLLSHALCCHRRLSLPTP